MTTLNLALTTGLLLFGFQAVAQSDSESSISIVPSATPVTSVITTTTVTTTTSTAPVNPAAAPQQTTLPPQSMESVPSVRPELPVTPEPVAPSTSPGTAPSTAFVDDGSNDTASVVERAKRRIRESMASDPWLVSSVNKISMSADGESLTLSGFVNHSDERDAIDRIARESAGSLRLINSIRVR